MSSGSRMTCVCPCVCDSVCVCVSRCLSLSVHCVMCEARWTHCTAACVWLWQCIRDAACSVSFTSYYITLSAGALSLSLSLLVPSRGVIVQQGLCVFSLCLSSDWVCEWNMKRTLLLDLSLELLDLQDGLISADIRDTNFETYKYLAHRWLFISCYQWVNIQWCPSLCLHQTRREFLARCDYIRSESKRKFVEKGLTCCWWQKWRLSRFPGGVFLLAVQRNSSVYDNKAKV